MRKINLVFEKINKYFYFSTDKEKLKKQKKTGIRKGK